VSGAVRRAGRRDLDRVAELWIALTEHHAARDPYFALRHGAREEVRRLLEAQLRDPDCAILLAEGAGLCIVRVDRSPPILAEVERAEVTDLYVVPEARRRGLGSRLVEGALAWVRRRGVERVEVRVGADNAEGQAFWRATGFGDFMDVLQRRL
jgi:GNAT superfamily N-acetyltransferase